MPEKRPVIEYFFSFTSLWSYVGSAVFQDMTRRLNVEVVYKPIDLLAIFAAGGGKPVKERPMQRQAYRLVEMQRWREIRQIPLVLHPRFYPADPSFGHRMVLAALRDGHDVGMFVHAGLRAVWADELNVANPEQLVALADDTGLPGRKLLDAATRDQELVETERSLTHEAIDRQVFCAPFYFRGGEPFWGQDRLELLEAAVASGRTPVSFPRVGAD